MIKQLSFLLMVTSCQLVCAEEAVIPQATTVDHYQIIWTRAPFTAASATEGDKASGTWTLTGLAGSKDNPILFLENKESQEHVTVTKDKNNNDFQIITFNPQSELYLTTAQIRIAGQDTTVQFDKELVASRAPTPSLTPQPMQPLQPFGQPGYPNPNRMNFPMGVPGHPVHRILIPPPPGMPPNGQFNPFSGQPRPNFPTIPPPPK